LLLNESCILASINLHEIFNKKTKDIDWDLLKDISKTVTRFLEDVTEITEAPLPQINHMTKNLRRLGGGVLGWADLLVEMNIPYESSEAVELAEKLSWFINFHSWETSYEMGLERGPFGFYDAEKVDLHVVEKVLYNDKYGHSAISPEDLRKNGVRNVAVSSLAPTGSIAIIGGVNSGIEPFFALAYKRNITEGVGNIAKDSIYETNPALERKLKEFGCDKEQIFEILEFASNHGTLTGCPLVSEELQSIFKTANEIHWKNHVDIQAAWQEYTSNAISKTINIPEEATVQDIYDVYFYMWKSGLKGGTVYRNNSKSFQILEKPAKKD
jgi:ribonucleoside-diphosphate reductase alpha chain